MVGAVALGGLRSWVLATAWATSPTEGLEQSKHGSATSSASPLVLSTLLRRPTGGGREAEPVQDRRWGHCSAPMQETQPTAKTHCPHPCKLTVPPRRRLLLSLPCLDLQPQPLSRPPLLPAPRRLSRPTSAGGPGAVTAAAIGRTWPLSLLLRLRPRLLLRLRLRLRLPQLPWPWL